MSERTPKHDEGEDTERGRITTPPPMREDEDTRIVFSSWDLPLVPSR